MLTIQILSQGQTNLMSSDVVYWYVTTKSLDHHLLHCPVEFILFLDLIIMVTNQTRAYPQYI